MSNRAKYAKKKGQGEISLEVSMDGKEYSGASSAKMWELGLLLIKHHYSSHFYITLTNS